MISAAFPATLLCDAYKISHRAQYPKGTTHVYSTWIPRASYIGNVTDVVAFGFQGFVRKYLVDYFDEFFFGRDVEEVTAEYDRFIANFFGQPNPDHSHIEELHKLGYLPLRIKAVPEGTRVPLRVPMLTIENTDPRFFWLTNYVETLFSAEVWQPCTSATIALQFRELLDAYALKTTGSTAGVEFQGHDFSMRGMESVDAAAKSGAGHLLSFSGTDTLPAVSYLEKYYDANIETELVGTSIPATEHSVMCAYGQDERESFKHLITEVYPSGFVSIVSDTWDLWKVLTEVMPALKDEIMARDGRVVIRPDSGDPADIICGRPYELRYLNVEGVNVAEIKGVVETLWDTFGGTINEQGYKVLDPHVGAIYGDSISYNRAADIVERLESKGFASTNIVFGIGSYTYQYQTRDTFGFALKSTWVKIDGHEQFIFKAPKTDTSGVKKSLTGRVAVARIDNELVCFDQLTEEAERAWDSVNELQTIFEDGDVLNEQTLAEVRKQVRES